MPEPVNNPLLARCIRMAPSPGQGAAAYRTFRVLTVDGIETARRMLPRSTWFAHQRILRRAGLLPDPARPRRFWVDELMRRDGPSLRYKLRSLPGARLRVLWPWREDLDEGAIATVEAVVFQGRAWWLDVRYQDTGRRERLDFVTFVRDTEPLRASSHGVRDDAKPADCTGSSTATC